MRNCTPQRGEAENREETERKRAAILKQRTARDL